MQLDNIDELYELLTTATLALVAQGVVAVPDDTNFAAFERAHAEVAKRLWGARFSVPEEERGFVKGVAS